MWFHPLIYFSPNLLATGTGVVSVTLTIIYRYLLADIVSGTETKKKLVSVLRAAIIHGLLVSLIIHRLLWSHSWFTIPGSELLPSGYLVATTLGLILILVDYLLGGGPDETIEHHRTEIIYELGDVRRGDLAQMFILGAILVLGWWIISVVDHGNRVISPQETLSTLKGLVAGESSLLEHGESFWRDIGISLLEIFLGIHVGGAIATLASLLSQKSPTFKVALLRVFGLTYGITIVLPGLVLNYIQIYVGVWLSIAVVALISFFPFVQTLLAFADYPWRCRYFLAVENTLPYASVGMLFGESIQAANGLGLNMTIASGTQNLSKGLAVAIATVFLFVSLVVSIRGLSRLACIRAKIA